VARHGSGAIAAPPAGGCAAPDARRVRRAHAATVEPTAAAVSNQRASARNAQRHLTTGRGRRVAAAGRTAAVVRRECGRRCRSERIARQRGAAPASVSGGAGGEPHAAASLLVQSPSQQPSPSSRCVLRGVRPNWPRRLGPRASPGGARI
jgi:hypothetical protein